METQQTKKSKNQYLLFIINFFAKYRFFKVLSSNLHTSNLAGNLKKV